MLTIRGKVFEVGSLENGNGRGLRMQSGGEDVEITGLTEDQCRQVAVRLGEEITIAIALDTVVPSVTERQT